MPITIRDTYLLIPRLSQDVKPHLGTAFGRSLLTPYLCHVVSVVGRSTGRPRASRCVPATCQDEKAGIGKSSCRRSNWIIAASSMESTRSV